MNLTTLDVEEAEQFPSAFKLFVDSTMKKIPHMEYALEYKALSD